MEIEWTNLEAKRERGGRRRRFQEAAAQSPRAVGDWARLEFPNEDPDWPMGRPGRRAGAPRRTRKGGRWDRWRRAVRRTLRLGQ